MAYTTSVRAMTVLSVTLLTVGYVLAAGVGYYEAISIWYSIPALAGLISGSLMSLWTIYLMVWKTADTVKQITSTDPSY